jgi:hypothetical protein
LGLPVNIHGQTTYINQRYNNFTSSYSGMNSLAAQKSMSYTWSGTLFFGARLAPDTDVYFNPEVISGVPFNLLPSSNGKLRITVSGTDIELRVSALTAGATVTIPIVGAGSSITTLAGCTPGVTDSLIIEVRTTSGTGALDGAWICDANLVAGELP